MAKTSPDPLWKLLFLIQALLPHPTRNATHLHTHNAFPTMSNVSVPVTSAPSVIMPTTTSTVADVTVKEIPTTIKIISI